MMLRTMDWFLCPCVNSVSLLRDQIESQLTARVPDKTLVFGRLVAVSTYCLKPDLLIRGCGFDDGHLLF